MTLSAHFSNATATCARGRLLLAALALAGAWSWEAPVALATCGDYVVMGGHRSVLPNSLGSGSGSSGSGHDRLSPAPHDLAIGPTGNPDGRGQVPGAPACHGAGCRQDRSLPYAPTRDGLPQSDHQRALPLAGEQNDSSASSCRAITAESGLLLAGFPQLLERPPK